MKGWKLEKERGAGPSQELKASEISPPHRQLDGQSPVPSVLLPTSSCPEASSCLLNPGMLRIADLPWELGRGQVAAGFWAPPLLILLEAEPSRPGPCRQEAELCVGISGAEALSVHGLRLQQTPHVPSIPSLCPQVFRCHSPAQNCCSVTGALRAVLTAPHGARLMKNSFIDRPHY